MSDAVDIAEGVNKVLGVVSEPQNIIQIDADLQSKAVDIINNSDQFFDPALWGQASVILILVGFAIMYGRRFSEFLDQRIMDLDFKTARKFSLRVIRRIPRIVVPTLSAIGFYIAAKIAAACGWPARFLIIAAGISFTLLVVIFAVSFIKSKALSRWVAKLAILVSGLHLFGWWGSAMEILDNIRFGLGSNQITLLAIMKGIMCFVVFFWVARLLAAVLEKQIKAADELTPSLKVLFSKLVKIFSIFIALMLGLNAVGVDLTSFAIFGGAIGVGLGFGLQKVVSNFISGIILLLDRSIKPGDVIAIDGPGGQTYGWVNTLGARYVSIIRRDGKEHLIPNEVMITERVENWSFSNEDIRIGIDIGVSYNADVQRARELCMEAVAEEPRVKEFPKPICHITGFGDNSVDLQIRGWINDPVNGIGNVRSAILERVWNKFQEHKIEIPFPQRDLNIRSIDPSILKTLKQEILEDLYKIQMVENEDDNETL